MAQTSLDLPWNFPTDWDEPKFTDGEIPQLAMDEGSRIIGIAKVAFQCGAHNAPDLKRIRIGVACYRLGYLFDSNREAIIEAIRTDRSHGRR